nr:MAG: ATPase [Thermoproteus sp. AZ2]
MPFNPSGVTNVVRLHRARGLEKELAQALELLDLVNRAKSNTLAVVVAPYGYGKSEFLDEVQAEAERRGLRTARLALASSFREEALRALSDKRAGEPLVVLIDEADELSRLAAMYKLGALSDERFRQAVMDLAAIVRALLEPRNYPHILRNPQNYDKVLIIAALTPQVYYTILKNVVPDVFDITTGRVYREIQLDPRFPFWQFVEVVKERLYAYSDERRRAEIDRGALSPLAPFTLHELAALYHIAIKKGEVSPRYLLKLAARLLQLKESGKGIADLAAEEGVPVGEPELAPYALSAIPIEKIEDKYIDIFKKIKVYKIPFSDKEAINIINKKLVLRGKEISPNDSKSASYEPHLYYTLLEGGKLYIYFFGEAEELKEYYVGDAYIISSDVAQKVSGEDSLAKISRELAERLQNPLTFLDEVEKTAGLTGLRLRACCGRAIWYNNLGFREAFLLFYINNDDELNKVREYINKIIIEGVVDNYPIDYVIALVFSPTLLTSELESALGPMLKASWKGVYPDLSEKFLYIDIYGADKLDKLKNKIIKYNIDKILGKQVDRIELVDNIKLYREEARENALKYTLALRRGKEKKDLALLKAAEQIASGQMPDGLAAFRIIEETLMRKIGDAEIHEKELLWLIEALFPVNLWRDMRAEDLISLLVYTGALIPDNKLYRKFDLESGRKYLNSLREEILKLINIEISIKSKIFGEIKLQRTLDVRPPPADFKDRAEYAQRVLEHKRALIEARERAEEAARELEKEAESKRKLLAELERIAEAMPQRRRFLALDEKIVARELEVAAKAEEIRRIWRELEPLAKELGKAVSVEADLEALLNLPEPWLDDYLASLKVYSAKLREEYERYREKVRLRERAAEWAKVRLGVVASDVESALGKIAKDLGAPYELIYSIAVRGPGAVVEPRQLAAELSLDEAQVVKWLEALAAKGLVEKRYVA